MHSFITKVGLTFLIFSLTIQALPLYNIVGTIGQSPFLFITPILIIILTINGSRLSITPFSKLWIKYILFTIFTGILLLLYLYIKTGVTSAYGENLTLKLIKNSYYILNYTITYIFVFNLFAKYYVISKEIVFQFTYVLLIVIAITEYFNPNFFQFIQYNHLYEESRLRLLSPEPSNAQLIFTIIFFLAMWERTSNKKPSPIINLIYIVSFLIISILIGSKGGLIYLFISAIIVTLRSRKISIRQKLKIALFYFPLLLLIAVSIFFYFILPPLLNDYESFNSFSTRLATQLSALKILITFPLGMGYGSYLYFFPRELSSITNYLITNDIIFSAKEIDSIISTGENLTAKSGIATQIIYNGWTAVVFFITLFYKANKTLNSFTTLKANEKMILNILLLYILLSISLSVNIETTYIILVPFFLLEILKSKYENTNYQPPRCNSIN